ncbi:thioesterase II family protein [Rummeliibacillus stabekisii]|uniref:thioesterase II family protein n=1 Tax=Rummeliibacillus stabekisii TaxID=241244 RepID=UPI00116CBE1E|nr:thioesterase domain-containing protein [Rummeliibacillus stabekisii]MBB5171644.1 surfactin synthase thioesterase subunit [Rummeliibacillus stabekisii]GEL05491.1 thioesterase [Rummeliibacillus stabekisii]
MESKTLNLLCLPYAGGSENIYFNWKKNIINGVNVIPIELSGRGRLIQQPLYKNIEEAIEDIYRKSYDHIINSPFALFGHSMGSIMVYELAKKIIKETKKKPEFLVFSGKNPPHVGLGTNYHELPNDLMLQKLQELGGIKPEFSKYPELLSLFLPIIRSDFKLVETYKHAPSNPFDRDIYIMHGSEDPITNGSRLKEWDNYTTSNCFYKEIEGDHFFIDTNSKDVIKYINSLCSKYSVYC